MEIYLKIDAIVKKNKSLLKWRLQGRKQSENNKDTTYHEVCKL